MNTIKYVEYTEEFFWKHYPNQTSWSELEENNPQLYRQLQKIGLSLVLQGKIYADYLSD